ncbi:hypothetical protein CRUP_011352, partial [Coryphaenoides rupestris]
MSAVPEEDGPRAGGRCRGRPRLPDTDRAGGGGCRGRPRLPDSDRARRRLESRKKYDVRRVYLGEAHRRHSCPHEPRLQGLGPQPGYASAATWHCPAEHSFLQYLLPAPGGASASEPEGEAEGGQQRTTTSDSVAPQANGAVPRRRRKRVQRAQKREKGSEKDVGEHPDVCGDHQAALDPPPAPEAPPHASSQPAWEGDVERSQRSSRQTGGGGGGSSSVEPTFHLLAESMHPEEEDQRRAEHTGGEGGGGGGGGCGDREVKFEEELEITAGGYTCVVMATALTDKLGKVEAEAEPALSHQTLELGAGLGVESEQAKLFESQGLQTMMDGCQLQGQRSSGSQLIIITGPGYEALATEGLQLNMAPGDMEEVTCTVIEGVAYDQVCQSDAELREAEEDEGSILGLSDKHGLEPTGEQQSRQRRRGQVVEADGMLKMFHCPYAGCSQVYVAISSYQNHVNLVHRKGRTKVCPHPGCGKKFYLSNHLHRHMIIHSDERRPSQSVHDAAETARGAVVFGYWSSDESRVSNRGTTERPNTVKEDGTCPQGYSALRPQGATATQSGVETCGLQWTTAESSGNA